MHIQTLSFSLSLHIILNSLFFKIFLHFVFFLVSGFTSSFNLHLESLFINFQNSTILSLHSFFSLLFHLLFVNRGELVGDVMVGGHLGCSGHEMIKIFDSWRRTGVSRTATLDVWRTDFGLSG